MFWRFAEPSNLGRPPVADSRKKERDRILRQSKVAAGFCARCFHRKPVEGKKECHVCRPKTASEALARLHNAVESGLCRVCLRSSVNGKGKRCDACVATRKADYYRKLAEGECIKCRAPSTSADHCDMHWFYMIGISHGLVARNGGVQLMQEIWDSQNGRCALTGHVLIKGETASLDHIVPISKGGTSSRENLRWVRLDVNGAKRAMSDEELIAMCRAVVDHHDGKVKTLSLVKGGG